MPSSSASSGEQKKKKDEPRKFKFPSHQSHMVNLAKMCQENKEYADCVIQCDGVKLKAHRLVLGSASTFLKLVFQEVRPSTYVVGETKLREPQFSRSQFFGIPDRLPTSIMYIHHLVIEMTQALNV